jgi:hypothetical protein
MRTSAAIFVLAAAWSGACSWAAEGNLPPDQWPTSVPEAVTHIVGRMSEADKKRLRETKEDDLIVFHHGWGTEIRNHYGLWRGNDKLILSACGRPCHPDHASMAIIAAIWRALQK